MARSKASQDAPSLFDQQPAGASVPAAAAPDAAGKPPSKPLLMVMDGHAMVFRAWFALQQARPMTVRQTGEDVRGVYSFTTTFFKTLNDLKPTHVAIAFDPPGPTFRDEQYAEYKANRPPTPRELYQNLERVKQVMKAFDVPVYELPGFEADDVLGTIAQQADEQQFDAVIVTGDSDTLQLVSDRVNVLLTTGFGDTKRYDVPAVRERYGGLDPDQQRDVKALTGDTSDNIPGVPGVGVKTAVKLILEFGSVEELLGRLDEVQPPRIQQLVRDHADTVRTAKTLVTIVRDAPAGFKMDDALFGDYRREDVLEIFRELEFSSLVTRIPQSTTEEAPTAATNELVKSADTSVTVVDTAAKLDAMMAALTTAGTVVFEAQASSQRAMEAALVGLAFAIAEGNAYYVPVGHAEGTQLAQEAVLERVVPLLQDDAVGKAGHNLNFSMTLLANYGMRPTSIRVAFDTMLAGAPGGREDAGPKAARLQPAQRRAEAGLGPGRHRAQADRLRRRQHRGGRGVRRGERGRHDSPHERAGPGA